MWTGSPPSSRTWPPSPSLRDVSFAAWARTWHWHGWISDVCLHTHALIDLSQEDAASRMLRQIERLHEGCVRAWDEFADTIPCIVDALPDGRMGLAVNTFASQRVGPRNPDFEPTEVLLDDPSLLDDGGSHLRALIEAARAKVHVEDSLNPHFGRTRYARDCKDRDWGYRLRLACRDSAEDIVAFRPQEFSTRLLHERVVTRLIEGSATSMLDLFASYAPGGDLAGQTPNGLPPGFQTLDEYKAAEDARRAALRHPDPDDDDPGP